MAFERRIKRYSAFFKGWCQAFGEHEADFQEAEAINWLIGEDQVGLIMAPELRKTVYKAMLGVKGEVPGLELANDYVQFGSFKHPFTTAMYTEGLNTLRELLRAGDEAHLYLTYHVMYPEGTRIVTFSKKAPMGLLYKEIEPTVITVV